MASKYWMNGAANGLWNDTNNWSATKDGLGGAGVPGVADTAIFTDLVVDNCTADAAITVASISNTSTNGSYTGVFDFDTQNVTVTSSFSWTAGTITCGSGTMTVTGTTNFSGGTITAETSKFIFLGTNVFYAGGNRFNNVDIGTAAATASSLTLAQDLYVTGTFAVANGAATTLNTGSSRLTLTQAAINLSNLDTLVNTGLICLGGAVKQTLTTNGLAFGDVFCHSSHADGVEMADDGNFRTLSCDSAKLTFNDGGTYAMLNFYCEGTAVASATPGTTYTMNVAMESSINKSTITDMDASGGNEISAGNGTNTDGGNNTNIRWSRADGRRRAVAYNFPIKKRKK